jgi:hypothetical protein
MKISQTLLIDFALFFCAAFSAYRGNTDWVIIWSATLIASVIRDEMQELRDQLKGGTHE